MEEIIKRLEKVEAYTLLAAKNVLNIDDVALLTGLSKSHLYKLTSQREIPHYRHGKYLYFDRKEIEDWQRQGKVMTTEETEQIAINYCVKGGRNGRK